MQMPRVDGCGVQLQLEGGHAVTRANQDIDTRLPAAKGIELRAKQIRGARNISLSWYTLRYNARFYDDKNRTGTTVRIGLHSNYIRIRTTVSYVIFPLVNYSAFAD